LYLVVVMDNGYIISVFQCKTIDDSRELAVILMQDMHFNPDKDDVAIFKPVPRQSTCDLVERWQDIYPDIIKENGKKKKNG
jgi:hypothetical protein